MNELTQLGQYLVNVAANTTVSRQAYQTPIALAFIIMKTLQLVSTIFLINNFELTVQKSKSCSEINLFFMNKFKYFRLRLFGLLNS